MMTNSINRRPVKSILCVLVFGLVFSAASLQAQDRNAAAKPDPAIQSDVKLQGEAAAPDGPLTLRYRQPAKQWVEALAIGNGRLGAMIFGGVDKERIQLNENTLWAGGPYDPSNPEALAALPEARKL